MALNSSKWEYSTWDSCLNSPRSNYNNYSNVINKKQNGYIDDVEEYVINNLEIEPSQLQCSLLKASNKLNS